jgi:hypothetical protein
LSDPDGLRPDRLLDGGHPAPPFRVCRIDVEHATVLPQRPHVIPTGLEQLGKRERIVERFFLLRGEDGTRRRRP